jgi:hypothetical protein
LNFATQSSPLLRAASAGGGDASRQLVFAQVMAHLPLSTFRRCVARYNGEHKVKSFVSVRPRHL